MGLLLAGFGWSLEELGDKEAWSSRSVGGNNSLTVVTVGIMGLLHLVAPQPLSWVSFLMCVRVSNRVYVCHCFVSYLLES